MRTLLLLLLLATFISSCCTEEPVQTARYELSTEELSLIPYHKGQQLTFVHSNGYQFSFVVAEDTTEWKKYFDFCEWHCCGQDFFTFQVKKTLLVSKYPQLNINLYLGGTEFGDFHPMVLNFDINSRHFAYLQYDSTAKFLCNAALHAKCFDSVQVGNRIFYDVYEKQFDSHLFIQDTSVLVPASLLYNKLGLIQIKMSNNETYSLK